MTTTPHLPPLTESQREILELIKSFPNLTHEDIVNHMVASDNAEARRNISNDLEYIIQQGYANRHPVTQAITAKEGV